MSCRGGRSIVAAVVAPSVREASHDGASTDGAAAAPTAARARQQGHPRMAMYVGSNAVTPDYPVQRLGASKLEHPPQLGWRRHDRLGLYDWFFSFIIIYVHNLTKHDITR